MGVVESLPVQRVRPVLCLPLFLGTLRDHSGYGNHASVGTGSPYWMTRGARDGVYSNDPGRLNIANNTSLQVGDMTIFVSGDFIAQETEYLLRSVDGNGIYFYLIAGNYVFHSVAADSTRAVNVVGSKSHAVSATAAASKPLFYMDGSLVGPGTANTSVAVPASNWYALGATASTGCKSPVSCILLYPAVLTPAEILSLHTWSQSRITPRKQWPGMGLRYPDRGDPYTPATGDPMFIDSIQTARITLANQASGFLSNTVLRINSGTWSLREDATGRYIYCVGNGQLQYNLIGASGYTTDLFTATGATLTKNANNFQIDAVAGNTVRAVRIVA